jgi:hypothetical protein
MKPSRMFISNEGLAIKMSMPAAFFIFYAWMLIDAPTFAVFLHRAVIFLPLAALFTWCVIVPVEIEANERESFVTIVKWRLHIPVQRDQIYYVEQDVAFFDTLRLKSGEEFTFIPQAGNKQLRSDFPNRKLTAPTLNR